MKTAQRLLVILILLNMAFIFYNSAETTTVSNDASMKIVRLAAPAVVQDYKEMPNSAKNEVLTKANSIIREFAHTLEFASLGLFIMLYLWTYPVFSKKRLTYGQRLLITVSFCLLYAISDEIHQLFVSGRTCEIIDVVFDTFGASLGALLVMVLKKAGDHL